ncbi:MAG: ATP-dependent DNA helicase RecG [Clostridia bacterium]|nr:ATP-dependent DNA helicase RecG [Clostridia bacterium]
MSEISNLSANIEQLPGIGPKKKESFERLGIRTYHDLLYHLPREYEDLRNLTEISHIANEEKILVRAKVLMIIKGKGYGLKRTLKLLTEDSTGRMEVIFFMGGYMERTFVQGQEYFFYGKAKNEQGRVIMFHPVFSSVLEEDELKILPVYPLTKGISQKELRKHIKTILFSFDAIQETLPTSIICKRNLCGLAYALRNIHFPDDEQKFREARYRFVYEELFDLQVALKFAKESFGKGKAGIRFDASVKATSFTDRLPYALTGAQARVLSEVEKDMESDRAMNRLVQGDVGSGKTVIAQAAIYKASKCGYQSAFMAPTELLARQHFETLNADFAPYGVRVGFMSGSLSLKARKNVLAQLKNGDINVIVGTHAIVSEGVEFANLGLVITDEQHRFGVNQRLQLSCKGKNPDILVMTATPIPRTLAVILYGDLDISLVDEMPPGRIPVETKKFTSESRDDAYDILFSEVQQGRQAYVVAPFIEDSEALDGRSAQSLFEEIKRRFPVVKSGLLYGSMKQQEKDEVMESFYAGITKILVSTVVIEVGINVQNASVMLVENAERFGLAQMHQLRGRVGRGADKSYCLIVTDAKTELASARAEVLCSISDGFIIAEKDLSLRGPGELFGIRQHGLPELKLADLSKHLKVFEEAKKDALDLFAKDPKLTSDDNYIFGERVKKKFASETSLVL